MKSTHIALLVLGLVAVGGGIFLFMRRNGGAVGLSYNRNVFGSGYGPPTGADISQRPGPPQSPIPTSVGRSIQQIKTGADAAVGLAKDIKSGVDYIKNLFS